MLYVTLIVTLVYLGARIWSVTMTEKNIAETAFLVLLLLCECFLTIQAFNYFGNSIRTISKENQEHKKEIPTLDYYPPVAIAICSYKEPLEVIEATMLCIRNLTYPNKQLYLLDDTRYDKGDQKEMAEYRAKVDKLCQSIGINIFRRHWQGAKAGIINDFLFNMCGEVKEGFETTKFQKDLESEQPIYYAIFDADMNPLPDFVEGLVQQLEADKQLGFIQTPQYYSNIYTNRVAHGAAMQQTIFYEYICEGKGSQNIMPCCGTNVIFRVKALYEVGGMDTDSVTEDFVTSLKLHLAGWSSKYSPHVCAFGMGPVDLAGYFKQQFRWALGSVGLIKNFISALLSNPKGLKLSEWFEYFSSATYYCIGWVWLIMWSAPLIYIFFGFPHSMANPWLIMSLFLPFFIFSMGCFIYCLVRRKHRARDIFIGMSLSAITFPVYMRASLLALLGYKGSFSITPKKGGKSLALIYLWPQLLMVMISVGAVTWGINSVYYEKLAPAALIINMIWTIYNGILVGMILYFNRPDHPIRILPRLTKPKFAA